MTIVAIAPTAIPWSRRFGESPFKNGAKNEGTCIAVSFSPDMFRREFTGHPDGFLSASWIESPNALRWRFRSLRRWAFIGQKSREIGP
jgi:hypothetical protein